MNWTKLLYVMIIILIYIPMTFLGVNVFFPEYTGINGYYQWKDCYMAQPVKTEYNTTEYTKQIEEQKRCAEDNQKQQIAWETNKNAYEGRKYLAVTLFNLAILLIALFIKMQDSVVMGLFLGSMGATFAATIRYFNTRSKIGFIFLVITFFAMIYFINKKKDRFIDWKTRK